MADPVQTKCPFVIAHPTPVLPSPAPVIAHPNPVIAGPTPVIASRRRSNLTTIGIRTNTKHNNPDKHRRLPRTLCALAMTLAQSYTRIAPLIAHPQGSGDPRV